MSVFWSLSFFIHSNLFIQYLCTVSFLSGLSNEYGRIQLKHWYHLPYLFRLPWWTVYIAWTLVISLSVVSSYFVMLYGLKYGYQKSVDWLVSFFTAFFQSAFITQPFKVIAISMVFTMILKKPVVVQGGKASTGNIQGHSQWVYRGKVQHR